MCARMDHIVLATLLYQSHVQLECSQIMNKHQNVLYAHQDGTVLAVILWTVVHPVIIALKALVTTGNLAVLGHTVTQLDWLQ